jgi:hypothetical protein
MSARDFDSEVWKAEKEAVIGGKLYKGVTHPGLSLNKKEVIEFERAIQAGDVSFRGNPAWNPGSSIYAPSLKDEEKRNQYVEEIIAALNKDIAPIEKVKLLLDVYGIGKGVATGLAMLFHPDEIAVQNKQSLNALKFLSEKKIISFGKKDQQIVSFQKKMKELADYVGAKNFLELDWFLYLMNIKKYMHGSPVSAELYEAKSKQDSSTNKRDGEQKMPAWIYLFTENEKFPEPVGEISALNDEFQKENESVYLMLADRRSPPMCSAKVGQAVLLVTRKRGSYELLLHARARVARTPRSFDIVPENVESIYGNVQNRVFVPINITTFYEEPHIVRELSDEEQRVFAQGQAFVRTF